MKLLHPRRELFLLGLGEVGEYYRWQVISGFWKNGVLLCNYLYVDLMGEDNFYLSRVSKVTIFP